MPVFHQHVLLLQLVHYNFVLLFHFYLQLEEEEEEEDKFDVLVSVKDPEKIGTIFTVLLCSLIYKYITCILGYGLIKD